MMARWQTVAVLVAVVAAMCGEGAAVCGKGAAVCGEGAADNVTAANATDFGQLASHRCSVKYSLTCFKLDALRLVDKLGNSPAYPLMPGMTLMHADYPPRADLPREVLEGNVTALDELLATRLSGYLNSLTLSVKLLDKGTVNGARRLGERILTERRATDLQTGRKKGGGGAAVWAAGTMAAVGMAALAAVSGKALMTSMLALMLAAAGALRGGGAGGGDSGKCSSYAYPATRRSIALDRPVYRPVAMPTYGPASP